MPLVVSRLALLVHHIFTIPRAPKPLTGTSHPGSIHGDGHPHRGSQGH